MKILVHHRIASRDGQTVHLEELTEALHRRGHEVLVVGPGIGNAAFGAERAVAATAVACGWVA